jgi:hypothetical protein
VSCAAGSRTARPVEPFSETYYAVKDLNFRDVEKLEGISVYGDYEQSGAAGLILGRHYVREGEIDKGLKLLERYYREDRLSKYMRYSGMLWLYDAYLKAGDPEAKNYYTLIDNRKEEDPFPMILKSFCSQEKDTEGREYFGYCDETSSEIPAEAEPETKIEIMPFIESPSFEKQEEKEATIFIKSSDPEFMQAAIAAIGMTKSKFKLQTSDGGQMSDYKIDPVMRTVEKKGETYRFDVNRDDIGFETGGFALLQPYDVAVVAYSDKYTVQAETLGEDFKTEKKPIRLINFTRGNFEHEMQVINEEVYRNSTKKNPVQKKFIVVVLADEKELIDIVPLVRYRLENPEQAKIVIGTGSFGMRYLDDNYIGYFRGTTVFTPVLLIGKENILEFRDFYMGQYDEEPSLGAYIAFDMIMFLKGRSPEDSLTGISYMDGEDVFRQVRGYKIMSGSRIVQIGE